MKGFRVNLLTGFIACGLLLLNLGGFVFSCTAEIPVASYAASVSVEGDDADDADVVLAGGAGALASRSLRTATMGNKARGNVHPARYAVATRPPLVTDHLPLTWHFAERAAAAPRAPSFFA